MADCCEDGCTDPGERRKVYDDRIDELVALSICDKHMRAEKLYFAIVAWGDKETGGNAAFSRDYGDHALDKLRALLGLGQLGDRNSTVRKPTG